MCIDNSNIIETIIIIYIMIMYLCYPLFVMKCVYLCLLVIFIFFIFVVIIDALFKCVCLLRDMMFENNIFNVDENIL